MRILFSVANIHKCELIYMLLYIARIYAMVVIHTYFSFPKLTKKYKGNSDVPLDNILP